MYSKLSKRSLDITAWISLGVVSQIHRVVMWNVHEAIMLFISVVLLLVAVISQILSLKMKSDRVKFFKSRK